MPVSDAKRRGNDKYNLKCDYISLRPLKPVGERIRRAAADAGESLQGYILDAVDTRIAFDESGQHEIDPALILNLIAWLREHGHDESDIISCLSCLGSDTERLRGES